MELYTKVQIIIKQSLTYPRHALQKVGTEIVRDLLPGILGLPDSKLHWCLMLYRTILEQVQTRLYTEKYPMYVMIGDLRFINEAEFLTKYFDTRIIRIDNAWVKPKDGEFLHESEAQIKHILVHRVIHNDGIDRSLFRENLKQAIQCIDFLVQETPILQIN